MTFPFVEITHQTMQNAYITQLHYHIKEQSLIQKQPSKSEGCFCIYARKAHNIRLSGLFLFSGDLVD